MSSVVSLIHRDTVKLLRLFGPEDITVLLTALRGVAPFNIQGMTVHSALLLRTSNLTTQPLTQDKLSTKNKAVKSTSIQETIQNLGISAYWL